MNKMDVPAVAWRLHRSDSGTEQDSDDSLPRLELVQCKDLSFKEVFFFSYLDVLCKSLMS